jgi:cytochrome P450
MAVPDQYDLLDPGLIESPYEFYRALVEQAPVYRVPGTPVFLVSRWELIEEVLANQQDYSANLTGVLVKGPGGGPELFDLTRFGGAVDAIANADEPRHSVHRRLVIPQLTARRVAAMEAEVRDWTSRRVQGMANRGGGDWVTEAADPVPVLAMARLIGLPLDDLPQFLGWAFSGGEILAGTTSLEDMASLAASTAAMTEYLRAHLDAALAGPVVEPPQNVTGELVLGIRGGLISEHEAISILVVLVGAAGESTSSLTGSAARLLAGRADLQQALREDERQIPAFVEEVVRLESPFRGHYRVVVRDTALNGEPLPAGTRLLLLWAAANRDPSRFPEPSVLRLDRDRPRDHLAFGQGMHFCVGARLARMEARVMVEELLRRTRSFSLADAQPPRHVPSIFVRRLVALPMLMEPAA